MLYLRAQALSLPACIESRPAAYQYASQVWLLSTGVAQDTERKTFYPRNVRGALKSHAQDKHSGKIAPHKDF